MIHELVSLNCLAVIVVALIAFFLGGLWYSPLLFVKPWMAEMKMTSEQMKAKSGGMVKTFASAFLLTLVSTATLATLIQDHHSVTVLSGAKLGLFVGIGLVAAREGTNAIFEQRTMRHFLIVAGYDVVLCGLQGAILGVWR